MLTRSLEYRLVAKIKRNPRNVRTHSNKQLQRLTESILQFGFTAPVLVDEKGFLLAGHARLEAAKAAGLLKIPVIEISGVSDAKKRALMLADNKIPEFAGYDRPTLASELKELSSLLAEEGLDLTLTGFDPAEIDNILADLADSEMISDEEAPEIEKNIVSQRGDLWILGESRLHCDDARSADYPRIMRSELAAMALADAPYNVPIPGVVGRGRTKHGNFAMACGEMSDAAYTKFLIEALTPIAENSTDGALVYLFIDWRHLRQMQDAGDNVFTELKNLAIWVKTNPGQGSLYRSQHEMVLIYKSGSDAHLNNIELGKYGRNRSNVWTYAGVNSFRSGRMADLTDHPTVKPLPLVVDLIRDASRRGDIILDPFMGSGTTLLAAEKVGRRAYGIEIDPTYVDVAVRRWQRFTRKDAILDGTGQTFDEIATNGRRIVRRRRP